jgi:hypothetical protein
LYEVIAEPPVLVGAVKVKVNCGLEPKAIPVTFERVPIVGADSGIEDGVMKVLAEEAKLVPLSLVAVTV